LILEFRLASVKPESEEIVSVAPDFPEKQEEYFCFPDKLSKKEK
jgi:hypothetical protein